MKAGDLRVFVSRRFREAGFGRAGRAWSRETADLIWVVDLDRSPYGDRFSIDVGVSVKRLLTEAPKAPNYSHVYMNAESLPLAITPMLDPKRLDTFRSQVAAALDLTSDQFEDEERLMAIDSILVKVTDFVKTVGTEVELRRLVARGAFPGGFVHRLLKEDAGS